MLERKILKGSREKSLEKIYVLSVQLSGGATKEWSTLFFFFFCFQALAGPSGQHLPGNRERGSYSGVFLACIIKAQNISSSAYPCSEPPKRHRAPTVRTVYFLLSWKAKVLLQLQGVTSIHQRKK